MVPDVAGPVVWERTRCAFTFVARHVVFQCSIYKANSAIPPFRLTTTVWEWNSLPAMKFYNYLSMYSFTSVTMMAESKLRHVRLDNSTLMPNMGITFKAFQTFKTLFCFDCPVSNEQKCFTYFSVLRLRWKVQKAELQFSRILSGAQCKIASSASGKFIPECRSKTLNKQGSPFSSKVGIQRGPV